MMYDYSKCDDCKDLNLYDKHNTACDDCVLSLDTTCIGEDDIPIPLDELNIFFTG